MKTLLERRTWRAVRVAALLLIASSCLARASFARSPSTASAPNAAPASSPTIVVTYSILGSIVEALAGDHARVIVMMPNGRDPHEWQPSAKDMQAIMDADLVVQNGLGLEAGMEKTLSQARSAGVRFFTASDHIAIRRVRESESTAHGHPEEEAGAPDPHFWMDPLAMKALVAPLAAELQNESGIDFSMRASELERGLDDLFEEISNDVRTLPEDDRVLVTGHESLGYFADRFGFRIAGTVVPGLTTQADVSAHDLAALLRVIREHDVKAIFTEMGTPKSVAVTVGEDAGVRVIELSTHLLPPDGSYATFLRDLARRIVEGSRR